MGTVIALDDITYLKELDAMKTQFVETVSHDLKNPLSVITGFIQLMEMDSTLSENSRTNLQGIKQSTDHMRVLITDLLDLARIEAGMGGDIQAEDLSQIVLEVLPNFDLQLSEKSMTLSTEIPFEAVPVLGNRLRLSQVVSNFVSNAIKYTSEGGHITVTLSREEAEVRLVVSDNGPGISPAGQKQLFQKFYRVPEIHHKTGVHGTGLGLSIVKAIVEGYGGRVWVDSQVGRGSIFGCVLPACQPGDDDV
jgi:signal transduction histidine kinase